MNLIKIGLVLINLDNVNRIEKRPGVIDLIFTNKTTESFDIEEAEHIWEQLCEQAANNTEKKVGKRHEFTPEANV
jgi:hypothetical protein